MLLNQTENYVPGLVTWAFFNKPLTVLKTNDGYIASVLDIAHKITADLLYPVVMIISSGHQIQWNTIGYT